MSRFSLYIAKRYLFSKKSTNVINIISGISVFGVTISTLALVVILSVFNGLDTLIKSLFNTFDPDFKITLTEGKSFNPNTQKLNRIKELDGIAVFSEIIEDNALLRYGEKEFVATIKGVSNNFSSLTGIDSMIIDGEFILENKNHMYAVVGYGIASTLSIGLTFIEPLVVYAPRKTNSNNINLQNVTKREVIYPSGIFSVQQEIDNKFIIVPLQFARNLFEYKKNITAIEIATNPGINVNELQDKIENILGTKYIIKNRYQQQEMMYKTIKSEKLIGFFILLFIIFIASFNIIGSLTMLIIDKKKDINTLLSLGADYSSIRQIFLLEGWLISVVGAIAGIILGVGFCFLQQKFELVSLQGSGSFIVDSYPVEIHMSDLLYIFIAVITIGFLAAWYPVRYITQRYL